MKIEVKFFTSLREITGKKIDKIQIKNNTNIKELLRLLSEKHGEKFREYIYNEYEEIQGFLSFLVNGKNINNMQGLDTKLKEGNIVAILPPVGGG
jgi:molybdopterin synthase sulfur carrier subunit